jgi:AsmA-like C-terminal region
MAFVPVSPEPTSAASPGQTYRRRHWMVVGAALFVVFLAVGFSFVSANWPYRYRKIKPMLEDVLASQIKISNYHRTYFPHPGFVATGITMRRRSAPNLPPLGSVETMAVEGSWLDMLMLRQRVQLVDITGLHIVVPAIGSRENHEDFQAGSASDFSGPDTKIERFFVHKSLLDIMHKDGNRSSFPIAELEIRNLHKAEAMTYAVDMRNAIPTGRILAKGGFGPINSKDFASTPVSGSFTFDGVELSDVGDISGSLDSAGHFKGTLSAIEAEAELTTPEFSVESGQASRVQGTIHCTINGNNGDLNIHSIDLKTGATLIHVEGEISGSPKKTNLDISVTRGRAEDVLRPFIHEDIPIAGPVWIKGHAYVGPPGDGFVERLRVDGVFDVPAERVEDRDTQKSLTEFSQRAQGDKSESSIAKTANSSSAADALSSLKGPASIRNGIASTQRLTFKIAGAEADLKGTFNFHNKQVHLIGNLKMNSDISHTATGFKSWLLKPIAPFFKKKHVGAVVPIAVTGAPGSYKVTQDIAHTQ